MPRAILVLVGSSQSEAARTTGEPSILLRTRKGLQTVFSPWHEDLLLALLESHKQTEQPSTRSVTNTDTVRLCSSFVATGDDEAELEEPDATLEEEAIEQNDLRQQFPLSFGGLLSSHCSA